MSKRSGSKSNVHDESSDSSGLPTLMLDSGSEESGSSRQFSPRSYKKACSQEKENSSPKKALTQFRLAPPRADKRKQEKALQQEKAIAELDAKLDPSRVDKRNEFENKASSARANSDRNMDLAKIRNSSPTTSPRATPRFFPRPPPRDKAPANQRSPGKNLSSMDDFFTEYAKIMDEFPEKIRRKGKKTSSSVIGW